jgi:hypothetical protein
VAKEDDHAQGANQVTDSSSNQGIPLPRHQWLPNSSALTVGTACGFLGAFLGGSLPGTYTGIGFLAGFAIGFGSVVIIVFQRLAQDTATASARAHLARANVGVPIYSAPLIFCPYCHKPFINKDLLSSFPDINSLGKTDTPLGGEKGEETQ